MYATPPVVGAGGGTPRDRAALAYGEATRFQRTEERVSTKTVHATMDSEAELYAAVEADDDAVTADPGRVMYTQLSHDGRHPAPPAPQEVDYTTVSAGTADPGRVMYTQLGHDGLHPAPPAPQEVDYTTVSAGTADHGRVMYTQLGHDGGMHRAPPAVQEVTYTTVSVADAGAPPWLQMDIGSRTEAEAILSAQDDGSGVLYYLVRGRTGTTTAFVLSFLHLGSFTHQVLDQPSPRAHFTVNGKLVKLGNTLQQLIPVVVAEHCARRKCSSVPITAAALGDASEA